MKAKYKALDQVSEDEEISDGLPFDYGYVDPRMMDVAPYRFSREFGMPGDEEVD